MSDVKWGAFVPQGWKLEYTGWSAADAWERTKAVAKEAEHIGVEIGAQLSVFLVELVGGETHRDVIEARLA